MTAALAMPFSIDIDQPRPARQATVRPLLGRPVNRNAPVAEAGLLSLAVMSNDAITGEGAAAYFRGRQGIRVVGADQAGTADVVLVLVTWVTEEALAWMQQLSASAENPDMRIVLVGNGLREHHLLRAVDFGLVSIMPRKDADYPAIHDAILAVRRGEAQMPGVELRWLVEQLRQIHHDVLQPHGLTASGLETREVDVLRLLSEGLGTAEIGERLCYSERTVKNILHGVMTRLNLKNRAHAVAYALRKGVL